MNIAGARRSLAGHDRCGDQFGWWRDGPFWILCLIDGLGHGTEAAEAADAALAGAALALGVAPDGVLAQIDEAIRHTRGAAMAVVRIDPGTRELEFAGVGNIRGALFGMRVSRFEAEPGIVGAGGRCRSVIRATWADGDMLMLWTDGFGAHLDLDQPSRRLLGLPQTLADRLLDRHATGRDDAGLVCCLLDAGRP